ncbi:hypothetical protein SDRG_07833 [Saprolegnia diclina VS20]|uniref:Knr4/Smi1-like domain-containing protein n=1 Tax=Saprolegnia diclina (strain VS20) TaxID=1156394 RepID=T0QL37_SAPDV|nr:hypothetical protein SDRG_07833 [Saprolegnia diclina VS20]EQC34505.1 hypothetical protein SDRG_07833 [Saprolegnia diclina VS20]|eukprot:XP_008611911.1 hypothetical protein SDRG_07833 [Saprolegnia diclina VS20]
MSVQVAEEGNKRKGGMTAEETEQCIFDILSWFQRKKANLPKATIEPEEVESLQKALGAPVPRALGYLLEKQNGGVWFNEYKSLSCDDMISTGETASRWESWARGFIPLAADPDGNLLVIDTKHANAVHECSEDGLGRELAASFSAYVENYRNDLLSGNFDFVEDLGLVERASRK